MLSYKIFKLNQKINTGGTEKNCGTSKLKSWGGKGNEENLVQSKKQSDNKKVK